MTTSRGNALVTGASRGLGLEAARLLARDGWRLTVVGRDGRTLAQAIRSLDGAGHETWTLDLARRADTYDLLARMRGETFDLVVNNAGGTTFGPLAALGAERIEEIIWLNFTAPALVTSAFVETAAPGATLINVTSIVAVLPMPGNGPYSAAKAGLKALTEAAWFEAERRGVRVVEFRPVSVRTAFHEQAGGGSLEGGGTRTDPAVAARELVGLVERSGVRAFSPGIAALVANGLSRLLPPGLRIRWLGRKAVRSGYLG